MPPVMVFLLSISLLKWLTCFDPVAFEKKVLSMDSISFHLDTTKKKKNLIHLVPFKDWVVTPN